MISNVDFLKFLRVPKTEFNNTFGKDFLVFTIIFALNILVLGIKYLVSNEPFVEEDDVKLLNASKIFSIVLLVPFVEELIFRGFLKFNKKYILALSIISYIVLCFSFVKQEEIRTILIIAIFIFGLLALFYSRFYQWLIRFIGNNLKLLIYISSLLFAIIHFSNYEDFELINLVVITQKIVAGLFLAFIVYKYNIWYSLLFHALNNMIPFIIIVLHGIMN